MSLYASGMCSNVPLPRKRCKRYDVPGHVHYLTFSCYDRKPLLARDEACRWLCDALNVAKTKVRFDLWAWVAMPEHVHLLVWPRDDTSVSDILRLVKLPVARKAVIRVQRGDADMADQMLCEGRGGRRSYRFWQRGGGYDRNIWTIAEVREKVEYIHRNPVRRGLVEHPSQWLWSSWRAWHCEGSVPIVRIDRESMPTL